MSPPIRDGSGDSIGSIRLGDGSEISEVRTGAGDVLFSAGPPDSENLLLRYDTREESFSNGQTITGLSDLSNNGNDANSVTGSPTYLINEFSGLPVVRFDFSDFIQASFSAVSQPLTVFFLGRWTTDNNDAHVYHASNNTNSEVITELNDGKFSLFSGNPVRSTTNADTNFHIIRTFFDGASDDSSIRVDQTNVLDNAASGTDALDGLTLGALSDGNNQGAIDVIEFLVYPEDKRGIQTEVERYLDRNTNLL